MGRVVFLKGYQPLSLWWVSIGFILMIMSLVKPLDPRALSNTC